MDSRLRLGGHDRLGDGEPHNPGCRDRHFLARIGEVVWSTPAFTRTRNERVLGDEADGNPGVADSPRFAVRTRVTGCVLQHALDGTQPRLGRPAVERGAVVGEVDPDTHGAHSRSDHVVCQTRRMRYVIFGAGAIGGVIGGRLHAAGHDVVLVARGEHLTALQRDGLRLRTPDGEERLAVTAVGSVAELGLTADDVVFLTVKSQDTVAALDDLRAAAPPDIAALRPLETHIDDELNGAPLDLFTQTNDIYLKRMDEASSIYPAILSKPFDFSAKETIVIDPESTRPGQT